MTSGLRSLGRDPRATTLDQVICAPRSKVEPLAGRRGAWLLVTGSAQRAPQEGKAVLRLVPQPSDAELVLAARAGDAQAEGQLARRHAPRVTRVLARILGYDGELADHAQEVMLRAFRDLSELREPAAFGGWVVALAVTQARRVLRKRKRFRWLFGERVEVELVDEVDSAGREALRAVYCVLGQLAEEERTVFALRYLEGMELGEAAAAMGYSLATLKRRLRDADQRFVLFARKQPALATWVARGRHDREEAP